MSSKNLIKSVGIVTLATVIGKLLGFGRETFMAAFFGTSYEADIYYVASVIPNILFAAIGMAITTGMVPLYIENRKKSPELANEQASVIATLFLLFSIIITVICFIFAPQLVSLVAPGFTDNPEHMDLAINLTRIMLPISVFLVLSSLAQGILNANKKFLAPALVTIPNNLIIILSIVLFTSTYGIYGVTIGTLIGGVSQYLIQYPSLKGNRLKINFNFKKHKEYIKKNVKLFLPIIIAGVSVQFIEVFNRIFASSLDEGSISALNYSMKLLYLPLSVLLMSIITVLFPNLVESAKEDLNQFISNVWRGFMALSLVTIPIAIVMIIDAENLVSIVFERGVFTHDDTVKTAYSFVFYSAGLIFIATREYLVRCFLALDKSRIIMYTSLFAMVFNIIASYILLQYLDHGGIALGTSLSFVLQTVVFLFLLKNTLKVDKNTLKEYGRDILKLFILIIVLFIIGLSIKPLLNMINNSLFEVIILTFIIFGSFALLAILLKINELIFMANILRRKFLK